MTEPVRKPLLEILAALGPEQLTEGTVLEFEDGLRVTMGPSQELPRDDGRWTITPQP
ncbi:hypothetical protein GCM10009719_17450 [Nocardioides kribbensis]